jgi:hypothetical protein
MATQRSDEAGWHGATAGAVEKFPAVWHRGTTLSPAAPRRAQFVPAKSSKPPDEATVHAVSFAQYEVLEICDQLPWMVKLLFACRDS